MASSDDAQLAQAFEHCEASVRAGDPDRAVASLFADASARPSLAALAAFDLETATVRDRVSQPLPGEIRLQWWRDTLAAGCDGQGSPVAMALIETIRRHDLPLAAFERLLDARIFDLYDDPMPSREAFETYAGETASTLITLSAMILDRERAPGCAGLAGHAGVALTAFSVAEADERLRTRHQVFVPEDILASLGLDAAGYLAGEGGGRVAAAMRAYGEDHARRVETAWGEVPRTIRPAFLPLRAAAARAKRGGSAPSRFAALRRTAGFWRAMRRPETGDVRAPG